MSTVAVVVAAEAVAIICSVTGPRESLGFNLRLPLLVLAAGALTAVAQWRRMVIVTSDMIVARSLFRTRRIPLSSVASVHRRTSGLTLITPNGGSAALPAPSSDEVAEACYDEVAQAQPVAMATPWLILNSSTGVAFLAAKGYEIHPLLVSGLLGFAGFVCLVTAGGYVIQWLRATEP